MSDKVTQIKSTYISRKGPIQAFEVHIATVRLSSGTEVFVGGADTDAVMEAWKKLVSIPVDENKIQHLALVQRDEDVEAI